VAISDSAQHGTAGAQRAQQFSSQARSQKLRFSRQQGVASMLPQQRLGMGCIQAQRSAPSLQGVQQRRGLGRGLQWRAAAEQPMHSLA
jgi:hypothetical protein